MTPKQFLEFQRDMAWFVRKYKMEMICVTRAEGQSIDINYCAFKTGTNEMRAIMQSLKNYLDNSTGLETERTVQIFKNDDLEKRST